jgi:hypothetical protein
MVNATPTAMTSARVRVRIFLNILNVPPLFYFARYAHEKIVLF